MAWQPPCPRLGIIAWTESPSKPTGPTDHGFKLDGGLSYKSRCSISSSRVASKIAWMSGDQPSNVFFRNGTVPSGFSSVSADPGSRARKA